jgi:uncharacterized membrane protein
MDPLSSLIAAALAFVGTHFALSHPLRAGLVRMAGPLGFQAIYSVVALGTFAWIILAFRAIGPGGAALWDGGGSIVWSIASLLTLVAAVLLAGSFAGNPALPDPRAAALADKPVHGVFHVTRHPMMWAFALWALAHALVSPTPRSLVVAAAIGFLGLAGSHMQDRKKRELMGQAWTTWEAKTSFRPRFGGLARAGIVPWIGGIAIWLAASWGHLWGNGIAAGIWRWL